MLSQDLTGRRGARPLRTDHDDRSSYDPLNTLKAYRNNRLASLEFVSVEIR